MLPASSTSERAQQLARLLTHAGYPPTFIEVIGGAGLECGIRIGSASIMIAREWSSLAELASEIAAEAQQRGVSSSRRSLRPPENRATRH